MRTRTALSIVISARWLDRPLTRSHVSAVRWLVPALVAYPFLLFLPLPFHLLTFSTLLIPGFAEGAAGFGILHRYEQRFLLSPFTSGSICLCVIVLPYLPLSAENQKKKRVGVSFVYLCWIFRRSLVSSTSLCFSLLLVDDLIDLCGRCSDLKRFTFLWLLFERWGCHGSFYFEFFLKN